VWLPSLPLQLLQLLRVNRVAGLFFYLSPHLIFRPSQNSLYQSPLVPRDPKKLIAALPPIRSPLPFFCQLRRPAVRKRTFVQGRCGPKPCFPRIDKSIIPSAAATMEAFFPPSPNISPLLVFPVSSFKGPLFYHLLPWDLFFPTILPVFCCWAVDLKIRICLL